MSIRTAIRVGPVDREHSIRNYLLRIYDKLGLSSRVELVLYAVSGTDSTPLPTQEQVRPGHIIHKTDQPDVVVHFFDPRGLTGEDRADVDSPLAQADAAMRLQWVTTTVLSWKE